MDSMAVSLVLGILNWWSLDSLGLQIIARKQNRLRQPIQTCPFITCDVTLTKTEELLLLPVFCFYPQIDPSRVSHNCVPARAMLFLLWADYEIVLTGKKTLGITAEILFTFYSSIRNITQQF